MFVVIVTVLSGCSLADSDAGPSEEAGTSTSALQWQLQWETSGDRDAILVVRDGGFPARALDPVLVVGDVELREYLYQEANLVLDEKNYLLINKNEINAVEIRKFMEKAKNKQASVGLLSDAGVPCVADPGSSVVSQAHELGFKVKPHSGPSSLLLALMASGFNGQSFTFHGYLPIDEKERKTKLRELETDSKQNNRTQLFIETPYRNMKLLEACLQSLSNGTRLCVAADLDSNDETIVTRTCGEWKREKLDFHKRPAVFLMHAGS